MRLIKNKSLLFFPAFLAGILLAGCGTPQTVAEKEQKALRVKEKVESPDFTFKAKTVYPIRFKPIHLTTNYTLKVSKDTVQANLPYFGRAYTAHLDPAENGIDFLSTDFRYKATEGNRPGNWTVIIKTNVKGRSVTLFLDVWDNGTAQLTVNDPDRQSISFDGNIDDDR